MTKKVTQNIQDHPVVDEILSPLPSDDEIISNVSLDIDALFTAFRDGNEPLEEVVSKAGRKSKEYEEKKKRAQRLAVLTAGMPPQQVKFVTHYVAKDWDTLSEVMIRCGSTAKDESLRRIAWQYLQKPEVKEAIVLSTLRKLDAEGVDRHEVIGMLKDTYNASMADGKYKEAKESAELLGTAVGMFNVSKVAKDLTKNETGQLAEMNRIARKAGMNQIPTEGEVNMAPSEATVDSLSEDLKNQLNIARSKISLN